jgi:hypothetical protein
VGVVFHDQPHILYFNSFATSTQFIGPVTGPGEFFLDYMVVSETFQPAYRRMRLVLSDHVDKVLLEGV